MNKGLATGAVMLAMAGAAAALALSPGAALSASSAATTKIPAASPVPAAPAAAVSAPDAVASAATAPGVQSVGMSVPRVVLARHVAVSAGHLRTPVLLTDPSVQASARVVGAPRSCSRELVAAAVVWVECAVPAGALTLEVVDGSGAVLTSRPIG